jgi:hypothetical protein
MVVLVLKNMVKNSPKLIHNITPTGKAKKIIKKLGYDRKQQFILSFRLSS